MVNGDWRYALAIGWRLAAVSGSGDGRRMEMEFTASVKKSWREMEVARRVGARGSSPVWRCDVLFREHTTPQSFGRGVGGRRRSSALALESATRPIRALTACGKSRTDILEDQRILACFVATAGARGHTGYPSQTDKTPS